jgi:murein DD-endopeptidase MepM/ murein hydrolase activator NlpD
MSETRRPFPQFNPFREYLMEELVNRKTTYPVPINSPFIRLTSAGIDSTIGYKYFTIGLHGYTAEDNLFDLAYGVGRDCVGYAYDLNATDENGFYKKKIIYADDIAPGTKQFLNLDAQIQIQDIERAEQAVEEQKSLNPRASHPIPGIVSANVQRRGLGQPLVATVQWKCYNRAQLEFLRNHFLTIGSYVILDFGQHFTQKQSTNLLNFGDPAVERVLLKSIGIDPQLKENEFPPLGQVGRAYVINNYNEPNSGNYDFMVGQVGNFDIKYQPETSIYTCTTTIVSQGENIWGFNINETGVSLTDRTNAPMSVNDYFRLGAYDRFLEIRKNKDPRVVSHKNNAHSGGEIAETALEYGKLSENPNDYLFFTWDFLFNDLFNNIVGVIQNPQIEKQIRQYAKLGVPADGDFVGYHDDLQTIEPDTMALITEKTLKKNKYFQKNQSVFGKTRSEDGAGAKIGEGVWINSEFVRTTFLQTSTLQQAITTLIVGINNAVANYWQLQLFFDDESATYKIIDYKYSAFDFDNGYYKFNVGGVGECLEVEFESAFPKELITQMMLVAKFATETPERKEQLVKQYPLLGSTSRHMFILNWTTMEDSIQKQISEINRNAAASENSDFRNVGPLADAETVTSTAVRRIADGTGGGQHTATATTTNKADIPSAPLGTSTLTQPLGGGIAPSRFGTRDSVDVASPYEPATNDTLQQLIIPPVAQPTGGPPLRVSSRFSPARNHPIDGETRPHKGDDIAAPIGTPVLAANTGRVSASRFSDTAGNMIIIDHGNNVQTKYFHLNERYIRVGQRVTRGQVIGTVGNTGNSTGPHLHYEVHVEGIPKDPQSVKGTPNNYRSVNPLNPDEIEPITGPNDGNSDAGLDVSPQPGTAFDAANGDPFERNTPLEQTITPDTQTIIDRNRAAEIKARRDYITMKFGDAMAAITAFNASDMIARITRSGYDNPDRPNNYVVPFPTSTKVSVKIVGLSGISISDGFLVDKIPFTYERYGLFQVIEVIDEITEAGWFTRITGYFKFMTYGNKRPKVII